MNIITISIVTVFIGKSCSQTLSKSVACFSNGDVLKLHCETADLTQVINFDLNGVNAGSCVPLIPTPCSAGLTQSGTITSLTISSFSDSTNSGSWTCTYGSSTSSAVNISATPCGILCKGILLGIVLLIIFNTVPESTEIILILIRLCCPCCCTQKVKVNVQTRMELRVATYDIKNNRQNQQMERRREDDKFHYSCFVYGEQTLTCRFESERSQLTVSFMISDDLLCADVDQRVTLPTIWDVNVHSLEENPIEWFLYNEPIDITNNNLYNVEGFLRISFPVRRETSGIYKFVMPAAELNGCVITVSNMRVSGRQRCPPCTESCLYLAICITVNLVFCLISVLIVALCRSNDGFCVENYQIVLAVAIPKVILNAVLIILIFKLRKKTGKGHSSDLGNGNQTKPEMELINPKPGELVKITGKRQPLQPL